VLSVEARAELLDGRRGTLDPIDLYRARFAETAGAELLTRLQDVDLGINLADDQLVKTDRASMAHSLEARVPFLDPVVADLAFSTPVQHKLRGLQKKRLLRAAVAPVIPDEILTAPKQGFSIPASAWLRGDLAPMARELLSPERLRAQGYFQPGPVARLLDEHLSRRADRSRQL
jgi:asparagine synthase (glutamine-hydrolysing)